MSQVILEVARYYAREKSEYGSVQDAARFAVNMLDAGEIWPVSITKDGQEVWHQDGPFGDCIDKLKELTNISEISKTNNG